MKYLLLFCALLSNGLYAQCPDLLWSDEFDGNSLNTADWNYQLGDGCDISSDLCGWGNNELQFYRSDNAVVADGVLSIIAKRENAGTRQYTSARLNTKDKQDFRYGRMEARIKLPRGGGLWPAFWMLPTDEVYGGWPRSGEIDIMEFVGNEPDVVLGTIHYGQPWPQNQFTGEKIELFDANFYEDYHVFAVEWEADEIRWFMDDILYSTKDVGDVSPQNWPFDQDFHFLLNVAVGGNLGGPVDNGIFPATMEVDYVRVYDGNRPYLTGGRLVDNGAAGLIYRVGNVDASATVEWTLPAGATIAEGAGSPAVRVDWGDGGGTLVAVVTTDCGTDTLRMDVAMRPPFNLGFTLENFDETGLATFDFATGTLTEVDNPDPAAPNTSTKVGRYVRNGGEQFDVIVYDVNSITNANEYVDGVKRFSIDVYTDAPVGTEILLQLETASAQPSNYPTGRHSRFRATINEQNRWQRLTFELLDRPDAGASPSGIQKLILLFASNTFTSNTYYYDNLDSYEEGTVSVNEGGRNDLAFGVSPNPARNVLNVELPEEISWEDTCELINAEGRIMKRWNAEAIKRLDVTELPRGLYFLRLKVGNRVGVRKVVLE